jgi:hypothetical protein
VPLVEQELLTLPEHPSSTPILSGVRVIRSLVLYACFVDHNTIRNNISVYKFNLSHIFDSYNIVPGSVPNYIRH